MAENRIKVLGGGPAGIAAAFALNRNGPHPAGVEVLDAAPRLGGNSASFQIEDIWCDYGSHRFHPVADPHVLADVKALLGDDLLLQPRHGRIRLGGRWIHFPLKLADALMRLPKPFAASLVRDMVLGKFRKPREGDATFSSVLYDGLGPTISENFYFPYVKKLWGLDPDELAVTLAERRVSGSSVGKILGKMMRMLPGLRSPTTGRFYYPKKGFGQISETMAQAAADKGATFTLNTPISGIVREGDKVVAITTGQGDDAVRHDADLVMSTIPITALVRAITPAAPDEVLKAADAIRYRGMILIYLVLETDQFTEYDAHYFPELSTPISRMSEPKNYNSASTPRGTTLLCAELPCDPGEKWWDMTDAELGEAFCGWLGDLGLPVTMPVKSCETRRLRHAYPVYDLDYQANFDVMDRWVSGLDGVLNFGRQGLFAHDNTHHAYAMAYGAVECVNEDLSIDRKLWSERRAEFAKHVVED